MIAVIVAAFVVFLVPQWLHRRVSAVDPVALAAEEVEEADMDRPVPGGFAARSRRSVPRVLVRRPVLDTSAAPEATAVRPHSAAARRRRILFVLMLATTLTLVAAGIGQAVGRAVVPWWAAAVPGALLVGYLGLLAVLRPGRAAMRSTRPGAAPAAAEGDLGPAVGDSAPAAVELPAEVEDVPAVPAPVTGAAVEHEGAEEGSSDDRWTPTPVPLPTYVTAPKAPRRIRTIDLSNPGSWTRTAPVTVPAGDAAPEATAETDEPARRVVGE